MLKADKQRHLLTLTVIAINEAVRRGVINLNGKSGDIMEKYLLLDIAGKPSVLNWFDVGDDELRVSLWWDYQPKMMPTSRRKWLEGFDTSTPTVNRMYFRFILGACGTCYLERKTGKFIIGDAGSQFSSYYVREDSLFYLNQIKAEKPEGYATNGRIKE